MPLTRFHDLRPGLAKTVLVVFAGIALLLALQALTIVEPAQDASRKGDLFMYGQVVGRLQAGESYYQALHTELVNGGYGLQSVFNWRPPFFLSALSLSPSPLLSQGVLVVLALLGLVLGRRLVSDVPSLWLKVGLSAMFVFSLLSAVAPQAELMCELYAGALILISVSAYGQNLPWSGFAAAVLALFVRELSIVYALVCVGLAVRDRRWREVAAWAGTLALFLLYYGWHAHMAMSMVGPGDAAYRDGWLQFQGAAFDIATAHFNGLLMLLPFWVSALLLVLAVLGLLAWPAAASERVLFAVLAYLAVFAIGGKPFNSYWGALYTPLLCFGVVWAVPALRDLLRAASRRPVLQG